MGESPEHLRRELIEAALGRPVQCVGGFKARGPDMTRMAGLPWAATVDTVWWGLRWLFRRPRRRLPAYVSIALADDQVLYAMELRWGPARVHRIVEQWSVSDVCVVRRSGWEVGEGIDAVDLVLPDETVSLRLVDVHDRGTQELIERIGSC